MNIHDVINYLKKKYPDPRCELKYNKNNPHELLIATRLSAQCTDKRVNLITPAMFGKYKSVKDFAEADVSDIENFTRSCGLYKVKSRDIVAMCKVLWEKWNGIVPGTMEDLLTLPGIGRKTANLILGEVYGVPAVITDTHVIRISNRLGLVDTTNPVKVETELRTLLSGSLANEQTLFCHRLVLFGREICTARKPLCDECGIKCHIRTTKSNPN
jgi:endonuclease-3